MAFKISIKVQNYILYGYPFCCCLTKSFYPNTTKLFTNFSDPDVFKCEWNNLNTALWSLV